MPHAVAIDVRMCWSGIVTPTPKTSGNILQNVATFWFAACCLSLLPWCLFLFVCLFIFFFFCSLSSEWGLRCRYAASTDAVGLECSDVAAAIVSHTSHECHFSRSTCHECVCGAYCAVFLMTHTPFIRLLLLNRSVTSQIYFHTHNTTGDCRFFIESPPPTTAKQCFCFFLLTLLTVCGIVGGRRIFSLHRAIDNVIYLFWLMLKGTKNSDSRLERVWLENRAQGFHTSVHGVDNDKPILT